MITCTNANLSNRYPSSVIGLRVALGINSALNPPMDIRAIRKANLLHLVGKEETAADFARKVGVDPKQVSHILTGFRNMGHEIARRIEDALDMQPGAMDSPLLEAMADNLKNYLAEPRAEYADDIVLIPFIDAQVGAGPGVQNGDERTLDLHQYSRAWIDRNGLHAPALRRVKVTGDSMRPTIFDGDVALVNTAERKITNGKVFAFIVDGEARVKRLFKQFDGRIRVVSDNPDKLQFPDEFLTPDHMPEMVGRVVDRSGKADL
jgi:phage repressor protein C with HTH and peptisase S24 domain